MSSRLRLRRYDGQVYLERWGFEVEKLGRSGIFLHKMTSPDPGIDLHDHPWWFASIVLWGGYDEERADIREASMMAKVAEDRGVDQRGWLSGRKRWSLKSTPLDVCHRITRLHKPTVWTLVIHGPHRRVWGFYPPEGYMDEPTYDATIRAGRRDLWNEDV